MRALRPFVTRLPIETGATTLIRIRGEHVSFACQPREKLDALVSAEPGDIFVAVWKGTNEQHIFDVDIPATIARLEAPR